MTEPTTYAPRASDVNARGTRVRLVEAGSGAPLLLVHDYLASHLSWEGVMPALATGARVIAPDLPGFGDSEKPPHDRYAYGFDSFADTLADIVAALGLSRVTVCGHGLGGAVALTLAARHPDLVERLVVEAPFVYAARLGALIRAAALPVLGAVAFKQLLGRAVFRRHFREHVYAGDLPEELVDTHFDMFNAPAAREAAYATALALLDTRAVVAKVPRVTGPALVVWGRDDACAPIADGRRLARELRGARFEVLETGHAAHEERTPDFLRVVRRFLAEATGRGA